MGSNNRATHLNFQAIAVCGETACGTPPLLPVCCVCGLVRDEVRGASKHICWIPLTTYRRNHKTDSIDCFFTHTYCPDCLGQARARMLQFFQSQEHQRDRSGSTA